VALREFGPWMLTKMHECFKFLIETGREQKPTHDDLSQPANTVKNIDRIIIKARSTQSSIQVIVQHVSNIDEVEHTIRC
jgi:hypothetical protein